MKKILIPITIAATALAVACTHIGATQPEFVRAGDDGNFYIGDSAYRFVGANFWYGAILGSTGQGGDRERLDKELDLMQQVGIDNLRVLVGGDGDTSAPSHIRPILQTAPGIYNDTILDGLDYLMAQLEKRDMKAVLYLNNAWEWSGGYGAYLEWAGEGKCPDPNADGYRDYVNHVKKFVLNDSAKSMALNHARNIAGRTNRYTRKPYSQSPALMAWEIANEPRAFDRDSLSKQAFYDWLISMARAIKETDPNHMVSTGSEGMFGCEYDIDLWAKIHNAAEIDYAIVHLWPYNWRWVNATTCNDSTDRALRRTVEYITRHADKTGKPLVLEEFGYPRDSMLYSPEAPTTARDKFYKGVFDLITDSALIAGCNIWGWGGYAVPAHENWLDGDPYTGDPAQEAQGLNSVFATDTSTLDIIKNAASKFTKK